MSNSRDEQQTTCQSKCRAADTVGLLPTKPNVGGLKRRGSAPARSAWALLAAPTLNAHSFWAGDWPSTVVWFRFRNGIRFRLQSRPGSSPAPPRLISQRPCETSWRSARAWVGSQAEEAFLFSWRNISPPLSHCPLRRRNKSGNIFGLRLVSGDN